MKTSSLTPEEAAGLLKKAGNPSITTDRIHHDIESGAPTNEDGTLNLLHYGAWLAKRAAEATRKRG